jgi:hypothetical protein
LPNGMMVPVDISQTVDPSVDAYLRRADFPYWPSVRQYG